MSDVEICGGEVSDGKSCGEICLIKIIELPPRPVSASGTKRNYETAFPPLTPCKCSSSDSNEYEENKAIEEGGKEEDGENEENAYFDDDENVEQYMKYNFDANDEEFQEFEGNEDATCYVNWYNNAEDDEEGSFSQTIFNWNIESDSDYDSDSYKFCWLDDF